MNTTVVVNRPIEAPIIVAPQNLEATVVELARCLGQAHTVRARRLLDNGHAAPALADLDAAIRLDPENAEALQLRGMIERQPGQDHPAGANPAGTEGGGPGIDAGPIPRTRFETGYSVMARHPDDPGRGDDLLETGFSLTPGGFLEAVAYARHMCSDESSHERGLLYDAYKTPGEKFDTVVVEYRSLSREVHLETCERDDDAAGH